MKEYTAGCATLILLLATCSCTPNARADVFGSDTNAFEIEFVDIGDIGNPDDTTSNRGPVGNVEYAFRMGKFEVSEDMIDKANAIGGLSITHDNRGQNKPATSVTWFEAARFVNWLNSSSSRNPAYKFSGSTFQLWEPGDIGYDPANPFRNTLAYYFLPSFDEWYKAAHYDPAAGVYYDYPTGSNGAPLAVASGTTSETAVYSQHPSQGPADIQMAGGLSPYGTMGQGGNVWEWEETEHDLVNDCPAPEFVPCESLRGLSGGDWSSSSLYVRDSQYPSHDTHFWGFRVASKSQPNTGLTGYISTRTANSVVYEIDIDTGSLNALGPSGIANIRSLEYTNGTLYAVGDDGLWSVDTASGVGSLIGGDSTIDDLAATVGGVLYGNTESTLERQLMSIDPATGFATPVGPMTPFVSTNGLAIADDGTAVAWDDGAEWLFEVDLTDGSPTSLGPLNDAFFRALDYGPDGTLYGWTGTEVRSIDPTALSSTSIQPFAVDAYSFTLIADPTPFWNKQGPGYFNYDDPSNWTPDGPPTATEDANFVLDADVDITLCASEANHVKITNGIIRFGGSGSLVNQGRVSIGDALATASDNGAIVTLEGTDGAVWISSGTVEVGQVGYGSLTIAEGAELVTPKLLVGNGGDGYTEIFGRVATTHAEGETPVIVGSEGGLGWLIVGQNGELSLPHDGETIVGLGADATGHLWVSNTTANFNDLVLGLGGDGTLEVYGTLQQDNADIHIGVKDQANSVGNGEVLITNEGAQWNFRHGEIGVDGQGAIVVEYGAGAAAAGDVTFGVNTGSYGFGFVTSAGFEDTALDIAGNLTVGAHGRGKLNVFHGARVTVGGDLYLASETGNHEQNSISVHEAMLEVEGRMEVGRGGTAALYVGNGGTVQARNFTAGELPDSNGIVEVSGDQSRVLVQDSGIATQGTGSLSVRDGALYQTGRFWVGFMDQSNGSVVVDGVGSQLVVGAGPAQGGLLSLGGEKTTFSGGTGTIDVTGGASLIAGDNVTIGPNPEADGTLTVSGEGSLADFTEQNEIEEILWVGDRGVGRMSVLAGGQVKSETASIGEEAGSDGTATIDGEGTTWETERLVIGAAGIGGLNVVGGEVTVSQSAMTGRLAASIGTAAVGNGPATASWSVGDSLYVGGSDTAAGGSATIDVHPNGNLAIAEELKIWNGGIVNLAGGSLSLKNLNRMAGSQFDFASGELVFVTNAANHRVLDGAAVQDILGMAPEIGPSQRLVFEGPVSLATPINLAGGELVIGSVESGTEADFRSHFAWAMGMFEMTDSDLQVNSNGPLGPIVDLVPGQRLNAGGGLVLEGELNVLGTSARFGAASNISTGGDLNGINAMLTFAGGLTYSGEVDLRNSTIQGNVQNDDGSLSLRRSNTFTNDLSLGTDDDVFIDLAGTNDFDVLAVEGNVDLAGTLQLDAIGGFVPSPGDRYVIVEAGTLAGTFDGLPEAAYLGNFSGTDLHLIYTGGDGNDVEVIAKIFTADFDFDEEVDPADRARWESAFGVNILADANRDGRSGGADFLSWQRQNGSGVAANAAVPEPTGLLLAALAAAAVVAGNHTRWLSVA